MKHIALLHDIDQLISKLVPTYIPDSFPNVYNDKFTVEYCCSQMRPIYSRDESCDLLIIF